MFATERSHLKDLGFESEFLYDFLEVPSLVCVPSAGLQRVRLVVGIEPTVVNVAVLVEAFDGKGKYPSVRSDDLSNVVKDAPEVLEVAKRVAGKDQIEGFGGQQTVVGIGAFL